MIEHVPVKSSHIRSVGYDAPTQMLEITFADNSIYQYSGITKEQHEALMGAGSIGQYFAANLRDRAFVKLEDKK